MTTDLDTKLSAALHDAASTTSVSEDAYANILQRAGRLSGRRRPSRRALITTATILAATAGAGVTYAAVSDRLTQDQAQTIDQVPTCGLDTEHAQLVATTTGFGRTVDYWTVDGTDQYGDFLFVQGTTIGSGGCGGMSRAAAHPTLPWANYAFDNPVDGNSLFWFYGQAPAGTAEVEIVMSTGSTRAPIATNDGHFVVLAELPYDGIDHLERIDAYSADGELIASGVTAPTIEREAREND